MPKHDSLAAALAAFQAELPKLRKDETAKVKGESADGKPVNYSYGYADLAQVAEAVSMCLGQHGMAFTAFPTVGDGGGFGLEYSLMHEGGEERKGWWPLPDPMRTKPQQLGSAITYARRYAQMAVTNTFPDKEDDDGAAAVPANHDEWASSRPRTEQAPQAPQEPPKPPKTAWTDEEVFGYQAKMVTAELPKTVNAYDWMAGKGLHDRKVGNPADPTEPQRTATEIMASRLGDEALVPDNTVADIEGLKTIATDRGLLKIQVSETETLDQVLFEARELAQHAEVAAAKADTPDPQAE
jgi:hypothetical protein